MKPNLSKITPVIEPTGLFDRWAPRCLILLAGVVPLIFGLGFADTFDLPKMTCVYAADLVLIGLWVIQALQQGIIRLRRTGLDIPIGVFLLSAGISTVLSIDPSLSLFGTYRIYAFGFLPCVAFAILFWLAAQAASENLIKHVVSIMIGTGAIVSLYGFLQYTDYEVFERMPHVAGGRVWSSLGNPIYMGAICMMSFLPALRRLIYPHSGVQVPYVTAGLPVLVTLGGMALSLSRSAWIGAVVGVLGMIWTYRRTQRPNPILWVFLAIGLGAVALGPQVRDRAMSLFSAQESSNAARIAGWKAGLKVWKAHPLTGSGTDTFFQAFRPYRTPEYIQEAGTEVTQADAHNDFVQLAATQGTLGVLAYVMMLIGFFVAVRKRPQPYHPGLVAGLIALVVQNQFNFSSVSTSVWAAITAGVLLGSSEAAQEFPIRSTVGRLCGVGLLAGCGVGLWMAFVPLRADAFYREGSLMSAQNQALAALVRQKEAVRLVPHNETYRMELANTYRTLGQLSAPGVQQDGYFDLAWSWANRCALDHPHNPDAWNNRGVAAMWMVQLANRKMYNEAKESFDRAVQLDPVFVDAWANLAKWNHLTGHPDEEKIYWRKVLSLDPQHPMARQVLEGTPHS